MAPPRAQPPIRVVHGGRGGGGTTIPSLPKFGGWGEEEGRASWLAAWLMLQLSLSAEEASYAWCESQRGARRSLWGWSLSEAQASARDLRGRLDVFVVPKINAAFAAWTELLVALEDNSQISGIFNCSVRSRHFVWTDRRGDLPGRNEKDRRPRGLDGFLDLYTLFVQACVGLKGDRW